MLPDSYWESLPPIITSEGLFIGDTPQVYWRERPFMNRMAEEIPMNSSVLEIGYGLGMLTDAIQRRMPRCHTVIEAHPELVKIARQRDGINVIQGYWQDLLSGYPDRSFKTIAFNSFDPPTTFFQVASRVLTIGGLLVAYTGCSVCPDETMQNEALTWFGQFKLIRETLKDNSESACIMVCYANR